MSVIISNNYEWLAVNCYKIKYFVPLCNAFSDIDVLLTQLTASKDAIGSAIDQLCDDGIFSETLFYTVTRSHKIFPALGGFISNVLVKIANKKPWKNDRNLWPHFVRCAVANAPHSYFVSCSEKLLYSKEVSQHLILFF